MPGVSVHFLEVGDEKPGEFFAKRTKHSRRWKPHDWSGSYAFCNFLRCMHSKGELKDYLLTERHVGNFYGDGNYEENRNRFLEELASEQILDNEEKRLALELLNVYFRRQGRFGEADDFLQTLFVMGDKDLENFVESNGESFRGTLEVVFGRGDFDANKACFLQKDLIVSGTEHYNEAVLALKGSLVAVHAIEVEGDADNNSQGSLTSGSSSFPNSSSVKAAGA